MTTANAIPNGLQPFKLRPAQRETIEMWLSSRRTIVLKARQIGFSTLVSHFGFWCTFFYGNRDIIMLSKTERDANDLLAHGKISYGQMPEWMKLMGPVTNWTTKGCKMAVVRHLRSLPSASDPARGKTAWLVVVDEFGR